MSTTVTAFTFDQASRLTGLSKRQLQYWSDTDFFLPSYSNARGKPYGRIYSFRDLVGLRTIAKLKRDYNVSLQNLRKLGEWLRDHYEDPWSSLRFYVGGGEIYFEDSETSTIRAGNRPQQTSFRIELESIAQEVAENITRLSERDPDEFGRIVRHRFTVHNRPVIAGTRISTQTIWEFHEAGYSVDEIIQEYPRLTRQDIEAAIEFECQNQQAAS